MENDVELEELKALWKANSETLEKSMRLNELLVAQGNMRRVETALGRMTRGITFELVMNLAAVVLIGWFAANNPEPRFLIPAALIDLYAIALVIANARQLAALRALDYDEPVVAIQKRLEALKVARIRTTLGVLLFAPLMWLPIVIVGTRLLFGVDLYAVASPAWLVANVLFGLAVIPIAIALARYFGARFARTAFGRRLADDIAGRSLAAAREDLDAIARFAREA